LQQAAEEEPLADEAARQRQTAEAQHEDRHHQSHARRFLSESREVVNVVSDKTATVQTDDDAERADVHQGVDKQVDDEADVAVFIRGDDAEQQVARVRDRRIGEQTFRVHLRDGCPVADHDRVGGDEAEERRPVSAHPAERFEKDARQQCETRGL
jgi:hypothetical protein